MSTNRYRIRTLERITGILRTFLSDKDGLTATEVGKRVGLDPSTAFRILVALEDQSLVERDPVTSRYTLGVTCLELGSKFLENNPIRPFALHALENLRDKFGETAHMCVLDGTEIVYIEKLAGLHPIGLLSSQVGSRAPAHCTAVGKVLLAFLSEAELTRRYPRRTLARYTDQTITDLEVLRRELAAIREARFAIDCEEFEIGVKCVAAPIVVQSSATAAVSVSGPFERMEENITTRDLVRCVQETASEITRKMILARSIGPFELARPRLSEIERSH